MSAHRNQRRFVTAAATAFTVFMLTMLVAPVATAVPRSGVITGRVSSTDGHPLAGVEVTAVIPASCDFVGCFPTVLGTTVSRADGTYRLLVDSAGPGDSVRVQFAAANATGGTSATGYANRCYGGDDNCAYGSGREYTNLPGRTITGINVALAPAAVIAGRLTDLQHRGVGSFPVYLYRHQPDLAPDGTIPVGYATSDVNGNYRLPQLAARSGWFVCFGDPREIGHVGTPAPDGYTSACVAQGVNTTSGRVSTVDATLQERGAIKGTVVDQFGQPVRGATVTVTLTNNVADGFDSESATTSASGVFRVGRLDASTDDQLCVSAPSFTDSCDYPSPVVRPGRVTSVGKLVLHRAS